MKKKPFELEYNKTNCIDNREGMKLLPDNCIDLTITSPPYDDLRNYKNCKWDFEVFKEVVTELYRVTKKGGVVVWIVGDSVTKGHKSLASFQHALYFEEIGFNVYDVIIFEKNSTSLPFKRRYFNTFEYMFILSKEKPKTVNLIKDRENKQAGKSAKSVRTSTKGISQIKSFGVRTNIWTYSVGANKSTKDKIAFNHPAIFPEKLVKDHILSWSNEGDLVMDIFAGSGTVRKMCRLNRREYIGFEISKEYVDIDNKRNTIRK